MVFYGFRTRGSLFKNSSDSILRFWVRDSKKPLESFNIFWKLFMGPIKLVEWKANGVVKRGNIF